MIDNFNYSNYTLISKRTNSENYLSQDCRYILKLPCESIDASLETLEKEVDDSSRIAALGIPVPRLIDTVKTCDGKIGTLGEYVNGKVSVSRAISEHPENTEAYLKRYISIGNTIHKSICDTTHFPSINKKIHDAVVSSFFLTTEEKNYLHNVADSVPDKNTCLHGDFHLSNIILSDSGDFAIDMGFFGYGNPIFDWGLTSIMLTYTTDEITRNMFHMPKYKALDVLRKCALIYLDAKDEKQADAFIRKTLPYGLAVFIMHHRVMNTEYGETFIKIMLNDLMPGIFTGQ